MGINLGGILGGIAGLLIPGGGAISAALGSGIGTLISGGKPKDAIKNALLFGAGSKIFPGVGAALQQTQVSRALGGMGLGTKAGIAAQMATAPAAATIPAATAAPAAKGISSGLLGNPNAIYMGLSALGALDKPEQPSPFSYGPGYSDPNIPLVSEEELRKNLYASAIDGKRFDSAEERDAYDDMMRERQKQQMQSSFDQSYSMGKKNFEYGGLIEGPGSVTSDDIPGRIMQDGLPTEEILVSNGEVIFSGRDLAQLDPNGDYERAGRELGNAPNGSRGAKAAEMFARTQEFKKGMNHG